MRRTATTWSPDRRLLVVGAAVQALGGTALLRLIAREARPAARRSELRHRDAVHVGPVRDLPGGARACPCRSPATARTGRRRHTTFAWAVVATAIASVLGRHRLPDLPGGRRAPVDARPSGTAPSAGPLRVRGVGGGLGVLADRRRALHDHPPVEPGAGPHHHRGHRPAAPGLPHPTGAGPGPVAVPLLGAPRWPSPASSGRSP